jgi:hypothetical protein
MGDLKAAPWGREMRRAAFWESWVNAMPEDKVPMGTSGEIRLGQKRWAQE